MTCSTIYYIDFEFFGFGTFWKQALQLCCSQFRMPHCISRWHWYIRSRPTLDTTVQPILLVPYRGGGGSFTGAKRSGRKTDHSHASSAEVKSKWSYTSTPPTCPHGVARDDLRTLPLISHRCIVYFFFFFFVKYEMLFLNTVRMNLGLPMATYT
jgi:hypothetical protein